MKRFLFLLPLLVCCWAAEAKIWRVNNNAGVAADFTSLDAAVNHSSVVNGDTIHVEPSATSYGSVNLSKSLVFIGNGYFLEGDGANSGLQYNTKASYIYSITFRPGSQGSKFYGISFVINGTVFWNFIGSTPLNLLFEKCNFMTGYLFVDGVHKNLTFRKCYLNAAGFFNPSVLENITIENNIMDNYHSIFYVAPTDLASSKNIIIRNNTFDFTVLNAAKAYVANNILTSANQNSFNNCVVENNIFCANQPGVTTGPLSSNGNNLINVSRSTLFVASGSTDGKFQLSAGSPALGGGVDIGGIKPDCGAFGGPDPYKLSGIPAIPTIYNLTLASPSVPFGTPSVNATISTRNNN
jgi:hypothetical protein